MGVETKPARAKAEEAAAEMPDVLSLADLFGREMEEEEAAPRLSMPPPEALVKRAARIAPVPSLAGLAPMWAEFGRGNTGKTLFARYMASELLERRVKRFILAALDPGTRLLAEFRMKVMQPPSTDQAQTTDWLRGFLGSVMKHRAPGVMDFGGGGETAWARLLRGVPTIAGEMEQAGVGLVGAYFLAAPDDPALLDAHHEAGFRPRATALMLNMQTVDGGAGFDAIRAHPAYKAALSRGAVEIIIPRLEPLKLSQRIEARRLHFFEARDGIVLEGTDIKPLDNGLERGAVREWLDAMGRELRVVEEAGWLPWS